MNLPDIGIIEVNGEIYDLIGISEFDHVIKEVPYSVELFVKKIHEDIISRDVLIQRAPYQWNNQRNSMLIESVLKNHQIGVILTACGRSESQCYAVNSLLDGLQRTTALVDYIDNKYALRKDAPPINCRWKNKSGDIIEQPFDIQRKKFKNLPLILQKQILEYKLTTYSYENFTDEELDGIVYSVNNGKQPTPFHKLRFALGTENMRLIQPLCNYVLWEDVKKCSVKNDSVLGCVIRIIMICTYNDTNGLSTSAMAKFVKDFGDKIKTSHIRKIKELIEQFGDIADKMTDAELNTLDCCNIPHYIANLRYFNELCSKHSTTETESKSYLDFFRSFLNSEEYSQFTAYKAVGNESGKRGEKSGSGGTQYSADSVEERQDIIDSYLEEFLDFPLEYNGIFRHNAITDSEADTQTTDPA